MKCSTFTKLVFITCFLAGQYAAAQTQLDVVIGSNNIPITEVQFTYDGSVITQTSGNPTTVSTDKPVMMNYFEINDGGMATIAYYNNFGTVVRNNNFTNSVVGVGIYDEGAFITADDPTTFEPALEKCVNALDLLNFLYYDYTSNLPGGDDFDILFAKGIESDDYVVVGERNGNTYFVVTPLDINGNPITTARKLRFGYVDGTNSGNGSLRYDWNIGYAPTNHSTQPMMYTVVDAELFETGGAPIYGFRIDNNGQADVKFFGLSGDSFEDNTNNTNVGGLMGNVYNDANGLVNNTVDGTGINSPESTALYATLYDNVVDTVISSIPVAADGSYEFLDLPAFSDYGVLISTNQGTTGAGLPSINLLTDWVNTGEHLGTGAGSDGTIDGKQEGLVVALALVPEVNFGIEKTPEADSYSYEISAPALDSYLTIGSGATADLSGDDNEDGILGTNDKFGITSLPTNGNELYYNGSQILLGEDGINPPSASNPFVIDNYDPSLLQIRFTGTGVDTEFEYVTIDAADRMPSTPAVYELIYKGGLTGNVFDDADGLTDSTVDGAAINAPDGTPLYATLYDNAVDTVISSIPVAADGSFEFLLLDAFSNYGVLISTNQGTTGAGLPSINLPKDWVNTGENLGASAGNDGTVDGNQAGLVVAQAIVPEVNFGIEKRPEADTYSYQISAPVVNSFFTIGSGSTSDLSGDDHEDGIFGTNDKFGITSLPTNGNELYYDGTQILLGEDGTNPPSASNPFVIDNYDPSLLEIRFTGPGATGTQFEYVTIDAAGWTPELPAVYELTYIGGLTGNVFNDADGLTDSTVNGAGINTPEGTQLYATLYDNAVDTVIASTPVAADGSFEFLFLDAFSDYGVLVSTNQGTTGAGLPTVSLPTDWVNTGENLGASAGDDGTVDGSQDGISVAQNLVPEVNFGIEKRPDADSYSFAIADPALDDFMTIGSGATQDLSGDDNEDGTLGTNDKFGITALPTNGNELYYDGAQIVFGADGTNPPSISNPFVIDNYDPSLLEIKFTGAGSTNTNFEYITFDAADNTASSAAIYELTYSSVLPVEWAAFEVKKEGHTAKIFFATATERLSSHFIIQKSLNGSDFRELGVIAAKGSSNYYAEYYFTDEALNMGTNYYRIAQVDMDGQVDYTEVQSVVFNEKQQTELYPNPVSNLAGSIGVKYYSPEEDVIISVTNMLGMVVKTVRVSQFAGWNTTSINIDGLTPGMYALRVGDKQKSVLFHVTD